MEEVLANLDIRCRQPACSCVKSLNVTMIYIVVKFNSSNIVCSMERMSVSFLSFAVWYVMPHHVQYAIFDAAKIGSNSTHG